MWILFFLAISTVTSKPWDVEEGCHVEMVEQCYTVPGMDCGEGQQVLGRSRGSEYRVKREEEAQAEPEPEPEGRRKRQAPSSRNCKVVRKCGLLMEVKCFDIPHMECIGAHVEGADKVCESVLRPVCWPVPREDLNNCVDEEVCDQVDEDGVSNEDLHDLYHEHPNINDLKRVHPDDGDVIEVLHDLYHEPPNNEDFEHADNTDPRCKPVDIEVCRMIPQAVNCGHPPTNFSFNKK